MQGAMNTVPTRAKCSNAKLTLIPRGTQREQLAKSILGKRKLFSFEKGFKQGCCNELDYYDWWVELAFHFLKLLVLPVRDDVLVLHKSSVEYKTEYKDSDEDRNHNDWKFPILST